MLRLARSVQPGHVVRNVRHMSLRHNEVLRTPDSQFLGLPDYDFKPHYFSSPRFSTNLGEPMRYHYLDEGAADAAETILLLHGEPSWCYLYRHMIPLLVAAGYRCIAPDLIGFGRSDKPVDDAQYTYAQHLEWLRDFVEGVDVRSATVVLQDWGGLLGLNLVAEDVASHGRRFRRAVVANTMLPTADLNSPEGTGDSINEAFFGWKAWAHSTELRGNKIGTMLSRAVGTKRPLSKEEMGAYDAPFPEEAYKAGARRFPELVPTPQTDSTGRPQPLQAAENVDAWNHLIANPIPTLCAFSEEDPIMQGLETLFMRHLPGCAGQPHVTVEKAGHFLQDGGFEQLSQAIVTFIDQNPAPPASGKLMPSGSGSML